MQHVPLTHHNARSSRTEAQLWCSPKQAGLRPQHRHPRCPSGASPGLRPASPGARQAPHLARVQPIRGNVTQVIFY